MSYFQCEPLYGLFVKAAQCKHAEETKSKLEAMKEKKRTPPAPAEAPAATPSKIPQLSHSTSSDLPPVPVLSAPETARPSPREVTLEKQLSSREDELAEAKSKIRGLTLMVDSLKNELSTTQTASKETHDTIDELKSQLASAIEEKSQYQTSLATLEAKLGEASLTEQQLRQQNDRAM